MLCETTALAQVQYVPHGGMPGMSSYEKLEGLHTPSA